MLVGQMLEQPELPSLDESGDLFAKQLLAKTMSVESALHHVWLQTCIQRHAQHSPVCLLSHAAGDC